MSTKPSDNVRWAVDLSDVDATNLTTPSSGQKSSGWTLGQAPPSGIFNWLGNKAYRWFKWLDDGDCEFHNLSATGTLSILGAFQLDGSLTVGGGLFNFTNFTYTADSGTDIFTKVAHGLQTGDGPVRTSNSGGALPTGLNASTDYYVIRLDDDTFKLALTRRGSLSVSAVDITTDGTGTQTLLHQSGTTRLTNATVTRNVVTTGGLQASGTSFVGGTAFTFPSTTFTASSVTNLLTITAHGLQQGDGPMRVSNSGGSLPGGLSAGTDYWVTNVEMNDFALAASFADAMNFIQIDLSSNGSGTNSIVSGTDAVYPAQFNVHGSMVVSGPVQVAGNVKLIGTSDLKHGDKTLCLSPLSGAFDLAAWNPTNGGTVIAQQASAQLLLPVNLLAGDRIKSISFSVFGDGSDDVTTTVHHIDTSMNETPIGTATTLNQPASWSTVTINVTDITLTGLEQIVIEFIASTGTGVTIGSVVVTFDRP